MVGDIHERNRKQICDLHLRESGDWIKSCWSLQTSDGLITLELINIKGPGDVYACLQPVTAEVYIEINIQMLDK